MAVVAPELASAPPGTPWGTLLSDLIRQRSVSLGSAPYVAHAQKDRGLSFRDLERAVDHWAIRLEGAGVAPGATVALMIGDPVDFSVAYLGTIASGRWAAPLDPASPRRGPGGLGTAIARVQPGIVIADAPDPGGLDVEWASLGDDSSFERGTVTDPGATVPVKGTSGGVILASSGTTGAPKVIPLHQHQLLWAARNVARHHELTPEDRGFNPLPLFHVNAEVVGLLASLVAGSSLVLDDRFHRTEFWCRMADHRITWINAVPAIISRLAEPRAGEVIPEGIRFIRSASAPLPTATAARFETTTGIGVLETYGMTEAASQITANPLRGRRKEGSVGLPVGVDLRIVADGQPSTAPTAGVTGHVEIRGPSVITAYGGHQDQERFDRDGWLRTGDLGHLDADGYLYLDARSDDVINRGGEKVFPREIEEVVAEEDEVAAVAVVGAPDPELGQVPVAYLVLRGVHDASDLDVARAALDRIRTRLGARLVRGKRPVTLNVVASLPTGATGKVRRRELGAGGGPVLYRLDCR
jgi:oxalate---CoA ligase